MSDDYKAMLTKSRERFERDTAKHEMTVLHDDGVYRHLRIQRPGSWTYGHDIVTWPGYLAITGDAGDYLFARTADMFEFFEGDGGRINPDYWGEKLQGPGHDKHLTYSEDAFRRRVRGWLDGREDCTGEPPSPDLVAAVDELLRREAYNDHEAHRLLDEFECGGVRIDDAWEWSLKDYDGRFLWCCWAIVRGIEQYRAVATVTA
jgi:hypothetical protein